MSGLSQSDPAQTGGLHAFWFSRHWRGELSLGVSFWLIGLFAKLVMDVIFLAIVTLDIELTALSYAVKVFAVWSIWLVLNIWVVVGVWRSASNHVSRGGQEFWAIVAKLMMAINVIVAGFTFSQNAVPQLREAYDLISGEQIFGSFDVRIVNGATEMEIYGGIPFGSAKEFEAHLDATPTIKTIHFHSHGGRIVEARKIADIIERRKLDTVVNGRCLSACVIAYLGGINRYIHPARAVFGFHRPSGAGMDEDDIAKVVAKTKFDAQRRGVTAPFLEKAYETPNSTFWYPKKEELFQSGYVTKMSDLHFAFTGFGKSSSEQQVKQIFDKIDIYKAINHVAPDIYEKIISIMVEAASLGYREDQTLAKTRIYLSSLVSAHVPLSSDEALYQMIELMVLEMEAINSKNPTDCHYFVNATTGRFVNLQLYFSPELTRKDLSLSAQILMSSSPERRNFALTEKESERLYALLFLKMKTEFGAKAVQSFFDMQTRPDPQITCTIYGFFYKALGKLDRSDAVKLLRHMFQV